MTDPDNSKNNEDSHPFLSHLIELRQRLLRCVIIVCGLCIGLMTYSTEIYGLFMQPMLAVLPNQSGFLASGTLAPFVTPFKLSVYLSLFIAMPYLLHQIWGFVSPGLYRNEKRIALPLLMASVVLFYTGILFAYFFVVPVLFRFMAGISIPGVTYMPDISASLDLLLNLFLGFGVAFEIPIATILLIITGATPAQSLAAKRPYIIVGVFILAAILTPPDVISQTMMALPMYLLFESGLLIGRILYHPDSEAE